MVIKRRLQPVYGTHTFAGVSGGGMRPRSYSTVPTRTPYTSNLSRADSIAYDTRVEDYLLSSRVDDASYLSSAMLDDTYDTAKRSRGRDAKLLRDATNAIVSSESYATPQTSVVSRRVARGRSVVPSRAASVPPRPVSNAYLQVDNSRSKGFTAASTTTTKATTFPRPIILYSAPRRVESRAKSVPPVTFADAYYGYGEKVRKEPVGWRMRAQRASRARSVPRAESVPPRAKSVPHRYSSPPRVSQTSEYTGRRRRARPGYTRARSVEAIPPPPLPTASLFAHKVPRRFLTRSGIRTYFSNMRGYYQHGTPAKGDRDQNEKVRRGAVRTRFVATPAARVTPVNPVGHYFARARLYAALPKPKPVSARESLSDFPQVYVPSRKGKPSNRAKAAIIASKMEPDPLKRRRPKSEFAAAKYRAMRKDHQESIYSGLPSSSGLSASNPPLPKLTERKAIRTEDGYTKPKNLMSWQYRLDSMMSPNDLLYQPSSFIRLREQVRDAQERMDRHRQLLDRYLPEGDNTDVAATVLRKMHEMEKRDAVGSSRPTRKQRAAKIIEKQEAL